MLDEITIGRHQEKLHDLLRELALSENMLWENERDLTAYFERLKNIYVLDFHHQYSKLFEVVNNVFDDEDKDVTVFQENLKTFRKFIMSLCPDTDAERLLKIFDKLRDHISLEISRRENLKNQNDQMIKLQDKYNELEGKATELKKEIERFSKMQIDFVAILSIFAAVVVAFSSGSNYMLNAISTVSRAFTKEIVFIILICGLILMDTLFMLIYFIGSIIKRSIGYKWWIACVANITVIVAIIWVCKM